MWCQDVNNDWQSEFEESIAPVLLKSVEPDVSSLVPLDTIRKVSFYDPWQNVWKEGERKSIFTLTDFRRSVVIRIKK